MKKISMILALTALLAASCSKEESARNNTTEKEPAVAVGFRLEAPVDTDFSVRPMAVSTSYKEWISNRIQMLVLKRIGSRWVVDGTQTALIDPQSGLFTELKLSGGLPACSFSFELRPGDYRVVAVLNPGAAKWNRELVPGVTVADDNDTSFRTPPLLTYAISTHFMNNGYRMLNREVFVAVTDFTVPKSSDLHTPSMPAVTLKAERRVAKIRFLLKDKHTPVNNFYFELTPHKIAMLLTAKDKPFAEGIDALGGMYYEGSGTYELPWCISTMGAFHTSGTSAYQICQTNSTVFSPFVFIDPQAGEQPVTFSQIIISGASEGPSYNTAGIFERTLAASKITGIVFEVTDTFDYSPPQLCIDVVEATDDGGAAEDAAALFDPYFEWNAQYDY